MAEPATTRKATLPRKSNAETTPKRLELLHELLPATKVMALLVNPSDPGLADSETNAALVAAHRLGLELHILHASNERDFNSVFPKLTEARAGGLVIGADVLFTSHVQQIAALTRQHATPAAAWTRLSYPTALSPRIASAGLRYTKRVAALVVVPDALFVGQREQLAALAARHAMPTIYSNRLYADAGGLMSYGASQFDAYRQAGVYVGRILSGANPADLPSAD